MIVKQIGWPPLARWEREGNADALRPARGIVAGAALMLAIYLALAVVWWLL